MKKILKSLTPPILFNLSNQYRTKNYGWFGDYSSWEEAQKNSSGYDNKKILEKVRTSLLKVKHGEALYERDSVLFDEIHYSWPLLSGLLLASSKSGGSLRVLDFGGSLGSTYYQNKKFLDQLENVSWNVVEQKHFVDVGKKDFADERLHFYYDIDSCVQEQHPNVLILSSVMQYIESPYTLLDTLLKNNFDFVLLDLMAISTSKERLTIQIVDPKIYTADYPCWMLDIDIINNIFIKNSFELISNFTALNDYKVISNGSEIGKYIGQIRIKNVK
ncbi:MAG: methyltransferase, TIGR04325 family [Sulfurimonas sp.]